MYLCMCGGTGERSVSRFVRERPQWQLGQDRRKKIYLPCDAAERATDDSHAYISCRVAIDVKILVSRMNISD